MNMDKPMKTKMFVLVWTCSYVFIWNIVVHRWANLPQNVQKKNQTNQHKHIRTKAIYILIQINNSIDMNYMIWQLLTSNLKHNFSI